jgi:autotransporter translocation and assembly factor TamB
MTMTGSWSQPKLVVHARVDGLHSGATSFRRWEVSARLQDDSLSGELIAEEEHGGSLAAHIDAPHAGKLEGEIQAKHFPLDVRSELLPGLRQARALLDGKIALVGTRLHPSLDGAFAISGGELLLANSAISYHALEGRLRFEPEKIVLQLFRGETGNGGGFDGDASLSFRGFVPQTLVGTLHLRRYPVAWESLSGLADANVSLDGKRGAQGFFTTVQLSEARVTLVDDQGLRGLIPLVRLDDIRVGTARPLPLSSPVAKSRSEPTGAIVVSVHGPMSVHGGEIDAQATSKLEIDLSTDIPTATGAITLSAGSVHLYGQVYDLERGSLRFDATSDALLDLRLARTVTKTRIGLELGGSARQPTMHFFAEAPEYDAAQVASMVTGQRRERGGVAKKGIGDKTTGPLSSLIATSFRQADPASEIVDVARPVRAQRKLDADAAAFPPATK